MIEHRQVNVPGGRLSLEVQGGGAPVLFVHGFAGDRRLWDGIWDDIAQERRAIRYDLRGFGQSVCDERAPFRHADDLGAVLDDLGVKTCDLVGVSMGGAIALNFTLDHPERVGRLALVSPGMVAWDWSEDWRSVWRPIVEAAQGGDLDRARRLWWTHPLFSTTRATPKAAEKLAESIQSYSGRHWADGDDEELALPDVERLWMLRTPTLLLSGSVDLPDFRLIADLIEAAAPDVRRIDYAEAGHMLHLERPDSFLADLRSFLVV